MSRHLTVEDPFSGANVGRHTRCDKEWWRIQDAFGEAAKAFKKERDFEKLLM